MQTTIRTVLIWTTSSPNLPVVPVLPNNKAQRTFGQATFDGAEIPRRAEAEGQAAVLIGLLGRRQDDACILGQTPDVEIRQLVGRHHLGRPQRNVRKNRRFGDVDDFYCVLS